MKPLSISFFALCCCWNLCLAQTFTAGGTYFDATGYVEYRAGNLPIIISAPHGGDLVPDDIPDRTCEGCVTVNDAWTKSIAVGLFDEIVATTGCYPHLVINLLHRRKFDANRDLDEAAAGDTTVARAWQAYHDFVDSAKADMIAAYGRGLFIDLHGHAHTIQRIELGYLLSRSDLQSTDAELNAEQLVRQSSIRGLAGDNVGELSHAELLRGASSLGSLLSEKGFPAVPSVTDPFPRGEEPYFTGGYNTQRHGSRDSDGPIDAVQVELNQTVRFEDSTRMVLIDSLAASVLDYYSLHYDAGFPSHFCRQPSAVPEIAHAAPDIWLGPNPADEYVIIAAELPFSEVEVYSSSGQLVIRTPAAAGQSIELSSLPSGLYLFRLLDRGRAVGASKLIVKQRNGD